LTFNTLSVFQAAFNFLVLNIYPDKIFHQNNAISIRFSPDPTIKLLPRRMDKRLPVLACRAGSSSRIQRFVFVDSWQPPLKDENPFIFEQNFFFKRNASANRIRSMPEI